MRFFLIEQKDGLVNIPGPMLMSGTVSMTGPVSAPNLDYTEITALVAALALKLDISAYTAADVLAKLLTVDGAGSGLDADLLDGQSSAAFLSAASYTAADVLAKLLTVDGAGSGLDADLLDGLSSLAFSAAAHTHAAAGNDTEVQYNDATVIGASSTLTFNKTTNVVQLGSAATPGSLIGPQGAATSAGVLLSVIGGAGGATSGNGGTAALIGGLPIDGVGGSCSIIGRAGATTTATNRNGGAVFLTSGAGVLGGTGGALTQAAGAAGATGAGGAVSITAGAGGATSGNGGATTLQGGLPVDGNGGSVSITGRAGVGTNRNGGSVNITAGAATGSGTAGSVVVTGVTTITGATSITGAVGVTGNVSLGTAGNKLSIKEGTNASMGVATLVLGTVVVNTTLVSATSRIQLTAQSLGTVTVPSALAVSARTAGTSFTILASALTDTSVVAWQITEPA